MADPTVLDDILDLKLDDLPETLRQSPGEGSPTAPAAEPVAAEPERPAQAPVAEPARPVAPGTFDEIESARQRYERESAEARARAEAASRPKADYKAIWARTQDTGDPSEVIEAIRRDVLAEAQGEVARVRHDTLAAKVALSEEYFRVEHKDYDRLMQDSGVADAVRGFLAGTAKDPYLAARIYGSVNPAKTAYEYAQGKARRAAPPAAAATTEAEQRGREEGRREVVQAVTRNAARPQGISNLPSTGTATGGLTVRDIAKMTDDQKKWIKKNRPDVWAAYLGRPAA